MRSDGGGARSGLVLVCWRFAHLHRYDAARASGRVDAGVDKPTQSLLTSSVANDEGRWKEERLRR